MSDRSVDVRLRLPERLTAGRDKSLRAKAEPNIALALWRANWNEAAGCSSPARNLRLLFLEQGF